ncbi:unnamed protein product [Heligmosomoides polygyrus]|uniref:Spondin domain-containing protein n=1 Tax=Heligmosomoides polygyrus TaxID=6339 RepID=A0A183FMY5_HELPZ|nr:unnamed protein product [Heligmosomoides polygyrus]
MVVPSSVMDQGSASGSTQTSPSPIVTPEPTIPELPVEVEAPESPLIQRFGDFASLDHDTPDGTRSQSSSLSPSIEQVSLFPETQSARVHDNCSRCVALASWQSCVAVFERDQRVRTARR